MKPLTEGKSLNEYTSTGIYGGYSFSDAPVVSIGVSILEVMKYSDKFILQRFSVIDGDIGVYVRKYRGSTWSSWVRLDNI